MGMWLQNKFLEAELLNPKMLTNAAKLSPTEVSLLQQQGYEACLAPVPFPAPSLSTQRYDKHHPSGSFCFSIMVMEADSRSSQLKFIHRSGWWYIPVPQSIGQAHSRETLGLIPSTIGEKKITLLWLLDQIFEKNLSLTFWRQKHSTL